MPPTFLNAHTTLNIAHRGASAVAPPNTLTAFSKAVLLGADPIELDVRLCADDVPVVIHDSTVDATTNGSGQVAHMMLAELKELDAGSSFHPAFAGERIPTLEQVLEAFGEQVLLNIDLKAEGLKPDGLEHAVVDLVERYALGKRVLLSSLNPLALHRVRKIAPHVPTGLVYTRAALPFVAFADLISPELFDAFHPHHTVVDEQHAAWARQHDRRMHVWTVDDRAEMRRLIALAVDSIITRVPNVLKSSSEDLG
ncbi:MAG: glycerophosphodiester phosphodiesterase family protein [Anaerolineae bacterium]|jgi:glycerophosphoryl diester phosphodiesterase